MEEQGLSFIAWAITHGHLLLPCRVTLERPLGSTATKDWEKVSNRLKRCKASKQKYPNSDKDWFDDPEWHALQAEWKGCFAADSGR